MQPHSRSRLLAVLLPLVLAAGLAACEDQDAQEDPRAALREAVMALGDYDGIELMIGAQLDEAARQSAMTEGDLDEEELALLTGSTLTVRGVSGDGDEDGESEFEVVVGDESVLTLRTLPDDQLYALIDLPAIERVAEQVDAGAGFQQGIDQVEQMAGMFGLGEVVAAAREAEWIRVVGLDQMAQMAEENAEGQPDEADLERLGREVGERLVAFIDDDVDVDHIGSDDAGERIRITAGGAELRDLIADVFDALDDATELSDPAGLGMDPAQLRAELESSIPDGIRVSVDAWVDGGELSQVAVDLFSIAREAGEEDVPDGEFLIAIGLAEFTGSIDAPDTDATFDVFEVFGGLLGGLGDLGGDDPFADEAPPDLDEDTCLTEDDVEQLRAQLPEEQRDLDDDELEAVIGLPVC